MKLFKLICMTSLLTFTSVTFADVAVIVHPSNNAQLSDQQIAKIFLKKQKSFSGQQKAIAINLPMKNAVRDEFQQKALNRSASQIKAYWAKLLFSGKGSAPKELTLETDVKAFVANNPNAIAYIDNKNVDASVKVVKVF